MVFVDGRMLDGNILIRFDLIISKVIIFEGFLDFQSQFSSVEFRLLRSEWFEEVRLL
jgi:hypothetical protein